MRTFLFVCYSAAVADTMNLPRNRLSGSDVVVPNANHFENADEKRVYEVRGAGRARRASAWLPAQAGAFFE